MSTTVLEKLYSVFVLSFYMNFESQFELDLL
jgi:hypothetical protein